jgi:hypothetical protein
VITHYDKNNLKELEITNQIIKNIQTLVLRKTLELIILKRRRGIEEDARQAKIAESIYTLCE